jgi:hypothetical protein
MKRSVILVCLLASVAYADKPASLAHYNKGKQAYAAGNFAVAAQEFEAAYAEWQTPEYLHDSGQAYRRLDRCSDAASAFERYLAAKPDAPNRATVTALIKELRAKCPAATPAPAPTAVAAPATPVAAPVAPTPAPQPAVARPSVAPTTIATTTTGTSIVAVHPLHRANPWHPSAAAGIALVNAGPVVMPPVPDLSVGVLRDMHLPLDLQVGANLSVARLPFDDLMSGTVWLAGPEAIAIIAHPVHPKLALTGSLAVGAQLVAGLSAGNPFTMDGTAHESFVMLRMRGEVGVGWRASERLTVRVGPGYVYMPRRSALAPDIHALHGLSLHAGVSLDL